MCLSVHMCMYKYSHSWSINKCIGSLGAGITTDCEPPDVVAGN